MKLKNENPQQLSPGSPPSSCTCPFFSTWEFIEQMIFL